MSTIAVNAITDANDGNTTTINGVTPNSANVVGKNLVINGAMQIAQRGTSTTGVTTNGYLACDRFFFYTDTMGTWTGEQSTDAPDEFSNSFKISCTTADASPAAGDRVNIQHRIEGQFLQHLAKGTASAKSVTLSFWIKSNKTGNMQVNLWDNDNSRFVSGTVTINTSATWEKKTITFVGDTVSNFDNDNGGSLFIEWWLDSGTTWSSGTSPTTWQANSAADRNANGTLALADSTSNYINITGVQLEVGESATEFEHRPYTTELQLCQRYYYLFPASSYRKYVINVIREPFQLATPMRASPTLTFVGLSLANLSLNLCTATKDTFNINLQYTAGGSGLIDGLFAAQLNAEL